MTSINYQNWELVFYMSSTIIIFGLFIYFGRKELAQIFSGYGVPFVPSSDNKINELVKHLKITKNQNFLDLGCGDGRVLEAIEQNYKKHHKTTIGLNLYGIENSQYPYQDAIKRKEDKKLHYTVYKKDFFTENFEKYDIIYCYLIPYLMTKIWNKIQKECKSGTILYSNSFPVKGVKPDEKIKTSSGIIYKYSVK